MCERSDRNSRSDRARDEELPRVKQENEKMRGEMSAMKGEISAMQSLIDELKRNVTAMDEVQEKVRDLEMELQLRSQIMDEMKFSYRQCVSRLYRFFG